MHIPTVGSLSRKLIPSYAYNRLRAMRGDFQYQERLGKLTPPWTAYGLLMATRAAKKYDIRSISVAEFGVANGRGLRRMTNLAERLSAQSGIKITVFGLDTSEGLPALAGYKDHPELFSEGDYPMQDFKGLEDELKGRAKLIIGDIRNIGSLDDILADSGPLGFASIDVDLYTSAKSTLKLISDAKTESLLPTVGLHFDDVWSDWGYNRFAGELLAIDEISDEYDLRKIDRDRYVSYWHGSWEPWHDAMYMLHAFDHPDRFKRLRDTTQVIASI
jgi:hypothetical protein